MYKIQFWLCYCKSKGLWAIHKRRWQFFRIFDTPLPHVGSFLVLSVGNFDQFLTPSQLPTSFMDSPSQAFWLFLYVITFFHYIDIKTVPVLLISLQTRGTSFMKEGRMLGIVFLTFTYNYNVCYIKIRSKRNESFCLRGNFFISYCKIFMAKPLK